MKFKTIGVLAGLTLLVIVIAMIVVNRDPAAQLPRSGELLFPHLLAKINDIQEVVVESYNQKVTLVRGDQKWQVKEKEDYPADMEKVKQTLIGLAELRILEPKTKNPELYDRLGLEDPQQEGSMSTAVELKTPDDPESTVIIIGNRRPAKGNPRMSDIYVRQPGQPQTWLAIGDLPLENVPGEWLEKDITAIPAKRVHRVRVTRPDGEILQISKGNPEDLDFHLESVPEGYKVASQFNVNNVAGTLVQLSLEDVQKDETVHFGPGPGTRAVVETFDGLRLHVHTIEQDEKVLGKFSAEFDPALIRPVDSEKDESSSASEKSDQAAAADDGDRQADDSDALEAEPVLKSQEEVQKEVAAFNKRVQGWVYELPKFRVENFSKSKEALIAEIS